MKTNMFIIMILGLSLNALAIDLPKVQKPQELESGEFEEGTITKLTADDMKEYLPWANNAKKTLEDALAESKRLPLRERMIFLENEVKSVVRGSAPKKYQQLMRFALNRGLLMVDILEKEANSKEIGVIQNQLDIINRSIKVSFEFYEPDLAFQKRVAEGNNVIMIPQANLGIKMAQEFLKSAEGILDATAQFQVMKKSFEILNWDLSQDKESKNYSEDIVEIYKTISKLPVQVQTDEEAIKHVRSMNYLKSKSLSLINMKTTFSTVTPTTQETQQKQEPCGQVGIPEQRIDSCDTQKGNYVLVTHTTMGKEFYRDVKNGLFWSFDKGQMSYSDAISACENLVMYDLKWRLPTRKEYEEAEKNKIRESFDFKGQRWWSYSVYANYPDGVWLFNGANGHVDDFNRSDYVGSVRCVAREN